MTMHSLLLKTTSALAAFAILASLFSFAMVTSVKQAHAASLTDQILCYVHQQLGSVSPFSFETDYCGSGVPTDPGSIPQCFDNADNDGDGLVDMNDPGCSSAVDTDETDPTPPSATTTSTVTIMKYVDGSMASAGSAGGDSFDFASSWNDQGGAGTGNGTFNLGSGNSYQITSSALNEGSSYMVHEVTSDMASSSNTLPAGASCQDGMWRLMGYRTGSSMANAQAATLSTASPTLSDISSNQYVIVENEECDDDGGGTGGNDAPMLTIVKHSMGGNGSFNFTVNGAATSTLTTVNGWATSSAMTLSTGSSTIAEVAMSGWETTSISCMEDGLSVGMSGGMSAHALSASMGDDITCTFMNTATSTGTTTDAALHVDSIDAQKTTAVANDTYQDGWRYVFRITTPNGEENLSMRFSDWFVSSTSSAVIPVAGNMRISSAQATDMNPVTLTAANAYSTPALIMTTDLDPSMPGRQVDVLVEVKIPNGTDNETYMTNYGVQTLP